MSFENKRGILNTFAKVFILIFFTSFIFCATVSATESGYISESVPKEYGNLIDELEGEVFDDLPTKIHSSDIDELGEVVEEMTSLDYVFSFIADNLGVGLADSLSLFVSLCGILVLSAVFSAFKSSFFGDGARVITMCSSAAIFALVLSSQSEHFLRVGEFFDRIAVIMNGMIPTVSVLYAMGGNVSTAMTSSSTLYIFLAFSEEICKASILPVAAVSTALSICGSISSGGIKLSGISSAIKKCYTFLLGLIMTLLLALLSSQTLLTSSADSVSAKAAKLIASNVIPVVGSSVGDTIRTVSSSVGYIKSVCGVGGILFILFLLLPILIKLLLARGVFIFAVAVADLVGCDNESKILSELGSVYGLLMAVVSMCSVMFILAITIFLRCSIALG